MDRAVGVKGARTVVVALAISALGVLSCCRHVIVCRLGKSPPDDFAAGLWTWNDSSPRTQLEAFVRRDGTGGWRVWGSATRTVTASGDVRADEDEMVAVWRSITDAQFESIDVGSPAADVGSGGASGIQQFTVWAHGAERHFWRPSGAADVEGIRRSVLALVPVGVAERFGPR